MHRVFSNLGLGQRFAVITGGACLLVALGVALVASLSSRYIVEQQQAAHAMQVARQMADQAAVHLARGNLIGLEVELQEQLAKHGLSSIKVFDIEGREIGDAGAASQRDTMTYSAEINIDGDLAGRLILALEPGEALQDQHSMALGLSLLAVLLSLFVAALTAQWANGSVVRLRSVIDRLQLNETVAADGSELEQLEACVDQLPLDLLRGGNQYDPSATNFDSAGLLFVRLNSLQSYVATLDENSLHRYIVFLQHMLGSVARLYGGELSVSRQFGLLLSFGGEHSEGRPMLRALCAAWLIQQLARGLQPPSRLQMALSMACASSEAGAENRNDIYPALYFQHLVDELSDMTASETEALLLHPSVELAELNDSVEIVMADNQVAVERFTDTLSDQLERHLQLLLRQLDSDR